MTAWLLEKQMEVEPGVFEHGSEYDFEDDDRVFVLDSETEALVGPFEAFEFLGSDGSTTESPTRQTKLAPASDELVRVKDPDILGLVETPELPQNVVDALTAAYDLGSERVDPDGFFGAESIDDTTETEEDSDSDEDAEEPRLQEVFTRQIGGEEVDFSGQSVTGHKQLSDTSLQGASLSDTEIENSTFRNVNLRDVDFRGAQLQGTTFTGPKTQLAGADFTGARLDGATFEVDVSNCTFTNAQMRDVDLTQAALESADFSHARMKRAKLNDTEPERASFDGAVVQNIKTAGAQFENSSFVGADLNNTTFARTTFDNVDFSEADLREAQFKECVLRDVAFTAANMNKLSLEDHDTSNLDFERADLSGGSLTNSSFESARFSGARLSGADFTECDLSGVSLNDARADGAWFDNADLEYATLSGADLTDASFQNTKLYTCQLVSARVGSDTDFDGIFDYLACDQIEDTGEDHPGRKAASVYRSLEAVYRNNSLTDESLRYHRKRKDALLRINWGERRYLPVGVDGFLKLTTGHGTELRRLVLSFGIFVAGTAIVHYVAGTIAHDELGVLSIANPNASLVSDVWQTLVFSLLAFTGLGYGRFTPTSTLGEALAVGQSAVGVLFFGLLVFVLSTRASR